MLPTIADAAHQLGFSAAGSCRLPSTDPSEWQAIHRRWRDLGYHADRPYLRRDPFKRLQKASLEIKARSAIVTLLNYNRRPAASSDGRCQISRYAGGRDYHRTMLSRLKSLQRLLSTTYPGAHHRCFVDSGGLPEKYLAWQAGLGWIGKNTLLINPDFGSWVFIGILLSTLELPVAKPLLPRCGDCQLCQARCPTQALREVRVEHRRTAYLLDCTSCLAYHTIETRTPFPARIAAALEGNLFGCDRCQEVCPYNQQRPVTDVEELYPRPPFDLPQPEQWSHWTDAEWDTATRGTVLRRPGYEGFVRNCRAVGKRPDNGDAT